MSRLLTAALICLVCPIARGAGIAVYNVTEKPVRFSISHPGQKPYPVTLEAGESRLLTVGRQPTIAISRPNKPEQYRLEPYHAYMFSPDKNEVVFHGIDLAGAMPRPNDVPADPPVASTLKLPVALYADDGNPRSRDGWEKLYRGRLAAASAVLEKQCGVSLAVTTVGEWRSDPTHGDLFRQAKLFERSVSAPAGTLVVGFTSRFPKPDGKPTEVANGYARGPLWPYLLVRDGHLRTESERLDALLREIGHFLGAAHSPDPLSAMRGNPADGRGYVGRYPVGLDPLNLLAVGIWVDEMRTGGPKSMADLKPISRERLAVIYKTLSGLLPTDELAAEHLASLERVGEAAVDPPPMAQVRPPAAGIPPPVPGAGDKPRPIEQVPNGAPPMPIGPQDGVLPIRPEPAPPAAVTKPAVPAAADRTEAVRKVVTAVRLRAIDLKRDPDADKAKGDALTVELMMAAGDIAYGLDGPMRVPAFLIGIGIALDDSTVLRNNLLFSGMVKAVESDAERAERIAALGTPTLRGRRDLLQHFVVSAALAELLGPTNAEVAGKLKELADRDGVSGFSFADLAADLAGIQLHLALNKYPEAVGRFRDGVNLNDYMPAITGLREGLTAAKFKELYSELGDPRFVAEVEAVRKRVTELPKYKEIAELKVK